MHPTNSPQNVLDLIELIYKYILEDNIDALALIARQKGLPPYLRYIIWPILLRKHPFVLNPFINPNYEVEDQRDDHYEIPIKQIRHDLKKYFQKNFSSNHVSTINGNTNNNKPYQQLTLLEQKVFKTLEYSIVKFLKKWGSIFHYEPGLTWLALNLAEWFPPLYNNKHYLDHNDCKLVLLGKDNSLRNINSHHNSTHKDSILRKFIEENDLSESSCVIDLFLGYNLNFSNFLNTENNNNREFQQFLKKLEELDAKIPLRYKLSFPEIYERLLLVFLHCDEPSDEELELYEQSIRENSNRKNNGNCNNNNNKATPPTIATTSSVRSSPTQSVYTPISVPLSSALKFTISSGTVHDRISFFLNLLKMLVPELHDFLKQEQLLTSSIFNLQNSNSEWLTWWVKWFGCKIFNKFDRGRIWDFVLGWKFQKDLILAARSNSKSDYISELKRLLDLENDSGSDEGLINGFYSILDHKQIKKLTNLKFFEAQKLKDTESDNFYYNSIINYQIEILFFYISVLKSKENLILELDQSEIKQFLNYNFSISSSSSSNLLDKKKIKLNNYYYISNVKKKTASNFIENIDGNDSKVRDANDELKKKKSNSKNGKNCNSNYKYNNLTEVLLTNIDNNTKKLSQITTDDTLNDQPSNKLVSSLSNISSPVYSPKPNTSNKIKFNSTKTRSHSIQQQRQDDIDELKSTTSSNASTGTTTTSATTITTGNTLLNNNNGKASKHKNLKLLVDSSNYSIDELIGNSYRFWKVWMNIQFSLMTQTQKKTQSSPQVKEQQQ